MLNSKLVIPAKFKDYYNNALGVSILGNSTFIGYQEQLDTLSDVMNRPETPSAILLGEQGIGKTALFEEWLRRNKDYVGITLNIELLGSLGQNKMEARLSTLLTDMNDIRRQMLGGTNKKMVLFIDEVHKLNGYGLTLGTSGAMNALKEGLARGVFPIIVATTDQEYQRMIVTDAAFDRRFSKIVLEPPSADTVLVILKTRLLKWAKEQQVKIQVSEATLKELIDFCDIYIKDQVNPAKSLSILESTFSHAVRMKTNIDHSTLNYVFKSQGYNIDSPVTAKQVKDAVGSAIIGQPLAVKMLFDNINATFYTKRNRRQPMMTLFFVGTTGVGKTETAKALAKVFFGGENSLLTLNCGDFGEASDAAKAQHFIGDQMSVNKQKIILLDELEKADPQVMFAFMRMIDEGIVRDSHGTERSINNTIIVATSNLGSSVFQDLKSSMKLDYRTDPNEFTPELEEKWWQRENDVRKNLTIGGDVDTKKFIKPEFLERFQMLVPFLPLSKKTNALIAQRKLKQFIREEQSIHYHFCLPPNYSKEQWDYLLEKNIYEDIDPVSVMIAEDIISSDSTQSGARTINRFINNFVKTKAAEVIANLEESHQSTDGIFYIRTNGQALFEDNDRGEPNIEVIYVPKSKTHDLEYINQILALNPRNRTKNLDSVHQFLAIKADD